MAEVFRLAGVFSTCGLRARHAMAVEIHGRAIVDWDYLLADRTFAVSTQRYSRRLNFSPVLVSAFQSAWSRFVGHGIVMRGSYRERSPAN